MSQNEQQATQIHQINNENELNEISQQDDENKDSRNKNHYRSTMTQLPFLRTTDKRHDNSRFWGDMKATKSTSHVRIAFRNINSLPIFATHPKNAEIVKDVTDSQIDILGCSETNVNWHYLPYEDRPYERFRGSFESMKASWSHNEDKEFKDRYQIGGVLMLATHPVGFRVIQTGGDSRKMGRWTWMLLQGKLGIKVRIVTVYRSVQSMGPSSAFQQQQNRLLKLDIDTNPRNQLMVDLQEELRVWTAQGNKIIVMGDFNEDVRGHYIKSFFQQFHMREIILEKHGNQAPNTFRGGTVPIDGIFANVTINADLSGYTACDWGMSTDHRLIWIDVDSEALFGTTAHIQGKAMARRLKCEDPRLVESFNKHRLSHHKKFDLLKRLEALNVKLQQEGLITATAKSFEDIDALRVNGILYADKQCRKLKMGHVHWCPDVQRSIKVIRYLRECCKIFKHSKWKNGIRIQVNTKPRTMKQLFKRSELKTQITNLADAEEKLKKEYLIYNALKKESLQHRNNYLEEIAKAQAKKNNTEVATVIQQLLIREQQRALSRKVKFIKGTFRAGVTSIEAPDNIGQWGVVNDKLLIEQGCMRENERRFTQANATPALLADQIEILGWTADTVHSEKILSRGTLHHQLHEEIKIMAPYLSMPTSIEEQGSMDTTITPEEWKSGWRKSKEYTATGKSGLHFGHFKASCDNDELMELDRRMAEISLIYGHSLTRWQQGIDVMIPKKSDSIRVDELRTIVLLEPDFNFVNKIVGRRLMSNAEKAHSLAPEQYGSRKQKSAIVHATNKQILFDIRRQRKQNTALLVLDAKSCYDRIAPPIASLSMKRQGAPSSVTTMMFDTLDNMKHYIRTAYGDSDQYYASNDEKFHGILQGNGAGPAIWAMVSSPILDYLRSQNFGVTITRPSTQIGITIPAFAFVDDTDLVQDLSNQELVSVMPTKALQAWELGLKVSGGALVPKKCNWYAMVHRWNGEKWSFETTLDKPGQVFLKQDDGANIEINRMEPDKAVLALGVMFAPNGNMEEEMSLLKSKGLLWAEQVRSSGITRDEAWYLLNSVVLKTIEYPLLSTTLTRNQLDEIMSPILKVGLTRSGICRNMNREIVYSKNKYFGLGIRHPFVTQGLRKLIMFMNSEESPFSDQIIMTAWELTATESGYGEHFLGSSMGKIGNIIDRTWTTTLWEFLDYYHITLTKEMNNPYRNQADFHLMQKVSIHEKPSEIKWFNYCRIYLRVELLSDLLTIDGKRIRKDVWTGKRNQSTNGILQEILQPRPTERLWTKWRRILRQMMGADEHGRLSVPTPIIKFSKWRWFWSNEAQRIFEICSATEVYIWSPVVQTARRSNRHSPRFGNRQLKHDAIIDEVQAITIQYIDQECVIESLQLHETNDIQEQVQQSIRDHISFTNLGSESVLQHAFITGKLIAVCDGSSKDGIGAAAWVLTTEDAYMSHWIQGCIQTPGQARFQDSHRSESMGILGIMVTLNELMDKWNNTKGAITIICDNLSALRASCDIEKFPKTSVSQADFDLIRSVRRHMHPTVEYRWQHVYGHQDNVEGHILSIPELLNVRMDTEAKLARESYEKEPSSINWETMIPYEGWVVSLDGMKISKNVEYEVLDYIDKNTMQKFWNKKLRIPQQYFRNVEWDAVEKAMKLFPQAKRTWIVKHVAGICGVNQTMVYWRQKESPNCKRCGLIEDATHVWKCPDPKANLLWDSSMSELAEWLEQQQTNPVLITKLIQGLNDWRHNTPRQTPHENDTLLIQQEQLGWNFVFEGCLAKEWATQQGEFFQQRGSKRTGVRWMVSVIRKLWQIAWEMWELRNEAEHLDDIREANRAANEEMELLINEGKDSSDRWVKQMVQEDRLQIIRNSTLKVKSAWIRNYKSASSRAIRRRNNSQDIGQMRRAMARYLTVPIPIL